jgi:hypothetical protein
MNNTLKQNNPFNNKKNELNFLLIGVSVIVGLIVVIIIYYVYTYSSNSSKVIANNNLRNTNNISSSTSNNNSVNEVNKTSGSNGSSKQVFHIADNVFSYDDAEAVCKAYGADLADYHQLVDAYKQGANWCNYGWVKGQMALYPIQQEYWNKIQEDDDADKQGACGVPGINGGYFENKNLQFGVNCFGDKRGPKGHEKIKSAYISDKERELQSKIMSFKKQLGNFTLTPFNEQKWSNCK